MSRWIDAEWLMNFFTDIPNNFTLTIGNLRATVDDAPSIDICFCKECVKHKTHRCHMAFDLIATEDNDFCSYGSRSEKPNNSTISKMEQVEDEPQTKDLFTDRDGDVWEWRGDAWYCISGDEPQTERSE